MGNRGGQGNRASTSAQPWAAYFPLVESPERNAGGGSIQPSRTTTLHQQAWRLAPGAVEDEPLFAGDTHVVGADRDNASGRVVELRRVNLPDDLDRLHRQIGCRELDFVLLESLDNPDLRTLPFRGPGHGLVKTHRSRAIDFVQEHGQPASVGLARYDNRRTVEFYRNGK